MKNIVKKIVSMLIIIAIMCSVSTIAFAAESVDISVITQDSEYYLTADEIINGDHFSKEKIEAATSGGAIILGGFDAPVSVLNGANTKAVGRVWCRAYATYDKNDGVSVNVELYVPWYYFTNPKFTSMTGDVTVTVNSKNTLKAFAAIANQEKTIEADVDTGVKASSGTKGYVSIVGRATGINIVGGDGHFETGFAITIP